MVGKQTSNAIIDAMKRFYVQGTNDYSKLIPMLTVSLTKAIKEGKGSSNIESRTEDLKGWIEDLPDLFEDGDIYTRITNQARVVEIMNAIAHEYMGVNGLENTKYKYMEAKDFCLEKLAKDCVENDIICGLAKDNNGLDVFVADIPEIGQVSWHLVENTKGALNKALGNVQSYKSKSNIVREVSEEEDRPRRQGLITVGMEKEQVVEAEKIVVGEYPYRVRPSDHTNSEFLRLLTIDEKLCSHQAVVIGSDSEKIGENLNLLYDVKKALILPRNRDRKDDINTIKEQLGDLLQGRQLDGKTMKTITQITRDHKDIDWYL